MNKPILPLLLALALMLSGCASLLERSYTVVEPYTDRYLDTAAEDTLRAESYHDLVNSLLLLVEQRSTEGVIRYYSKSGADVYLQALAARREVLEETVSGSYLLKNISLSYAGAELYSTLTVALQYREEAEDPSGLMMLSGTQSLADLLRMAVREEHPRLTARFFEETPGSEVEAAVEALWQELQQEDMTELPTEVPQEGAEGAAEGTTESAVGETPPAADGTEPSQPTEEEGTTDETTPEEPAPPVLTYPWTVRFYPDREAAEIVEILLTEG